MDCGHTVRDSDIDFRGTRCNILRLWYGDFDLFTAEVGDGKF
jgi:hypothetical protein